MKLRAPAIAGPTPLIPGIVWMAVSPPPRTNARRQVTRPIPHRLLEERLRRKGSTPHGRSPVSAGRRPALDGGEEGCMYNLVATRADVDLRSRSELS